jgi:ubiquinone/menaquinone biosynthesis C-methylase UbiE
VRRNHAHPFPLSVSLDTTVATTEMNLDDIQNAAQQQFARRSHQYSAAHILADTDDVAKGAALLELPPKAQVLDVATGAGHTALFFAEMGHAVTAADLAKPMLDRTAEAAAERNLAIETRQHAAEDFPYPDENFDLVTCRVAAHHFSSPDRFVAEVSRVLKPGGSFLLIDGSVHDEAPDAEEWLHRVEKLRDPSHHRFLSPSAWRGLCHAHFLDVQIAQLDPFKQPDLEWYFDTADTSPENRRAVHALVRTAPMEVRTQLGLAEENGKIVWWWPRLTLVARKGS